MMKSVPRSWDAVPNAVPQLTPQERMARIERIARLMDEAFQIPGTNFRVGWDSIAGLVPGIGDVATAVISGFIIQEARRMGVPRRTLLRMISNVGVDVLAGTVPLAGDLFDAAWKSNRKNVALLRKHLDKQAKRAAP